MREIKFRGKRHDNGKWITGDRLSINGHVFILPDPAPHGIDKYKVDPSTVGQFTGLKDKTGKEISEGDLSIDKLGRHSVVEYHHGGFWIRAIETGYSERLHDDRQIEITSNIHDNPELLESNT